MTTEVQAEVSRLRKIGTRMAVPLISLILALIVGTLVLLFMGENPILAFRSMFYDIFFTQVTNPDTGTTSNVLNLSTPANILFYATPLMLTGLSVAVAFRAGMFNIGTEGQVMVGGFLTALIGFGLNMYLGITLPAIIMVPLLLVAGCVGGALWAAIPGILKTRGVHEVISTILFNYIATTLMVFLVGDLKSPFSDKTLGGNASPQTPPISPTGRISTVFGREFSPFNWTFFIAIFVCIAIYVILWRTKLGYETRAVGYNPNAAKYGGISVKRNTVNVMLISGALGGLAGAFAVMGPLYGFFLYGSTRGLGFDGIAIAIIGENHPFGVIFGAILFGWLKGSEQKLQQNMIPKDLANTLKGFIVFIVAIPLLSKMIISYLAKHFAWIDIELQKYNEGIKDYPSLTGNPVEFLRTLGYNAIEFLKLLFRIFVQFLILLAIAIKSLLNRTYIVLKYHKLNVVVTILFVLFFLVFSLITGEFQTPLSTELGNLLTNAGIPFIGLSDTFISALVGGIISAVFISSILIMRRFNYKGSTENLILLYTTPFIIITYLRLINTFGQTTVLLSIFAIIIAFIIYQEMKAGKSITQEKIVEDNDITPEEIKKTINRYVISSIFVIFVILILSITANISLAPINIFLVILTSFGAIIGLITIPLVLGLFIWVRRTTLKPRELTKVYYLPTVFIVLLVFYGYTTISAIFSMNVYLLFTQTVSIAAPIGLAAIGGMFSEKSGVVNIGLEGMMLSGAFVGVWVTFVTNDPWFGVFGALLAGIVMGFLHAIASIKFRADQVVVGVAINILASATSMLGLIYVWDVRGTSPTVTGLDRISFPFLKEIPLIGEFLYGLTGGLTSSEYSPLVYIFLFLILFSYWIIHRTSFGLRVRAVGEHTRAADTLGINVFKMRYICVILSGMLAGLGGAQLSLGFSPIFGRDMTAGRGFVALAALIFGGWSPIGAGLASLLFGFAIAFRRQLEALGISWAITLVGTTWYFERLTPMIPYLLTIIAVATVAKRMRPPAEDGIPYVKEG